MSWNSLRYPQTFVFKTIAQLLLNKQFVKRMRVNKSTLHAYTLPYQRYQSISDFCFPTDRSMAKARKINEMQVGLLLPIFNPKRLKRLTLSIKRRSSVSLVPLVAPELQIRISETDLQEQIDEKRKSQAVCDGTHLRNPHRLQNQNPSVVFLGAALRSASARLPKGHPNVVLQTYSRDLSRANAI
ncbi:hypothetical protein L596_012370 [Steinernema carpocapsae]|uniref:Uncharacterized protein n=1 Tax=Steinernema carpocapsae TaxID=34508 RepID=A0A4U5NXR1_STECR|nr:hypothetical protein L596_012370 [Steinernema carpocapsae]